MESTTLVAVLAFGTLLAVAVWGMMSRTRIEERRQSNARKPTLAADKKPADI